MTASIHALEAGEAPYRWAIIDDGYLTHDERQILTFDPDPEEFPNGWAPLTAMKHPERIMETLREQGIAENTLVLFTSDNGPHDEGGHSVTRFDSAGGFQGYKRSLHEGGIRVPFIAWWPGTIEPGVTDHMGYFPDRFAELKALAVREHQAYTPQDPPVLAPLGYAAGVVYLECSNHGGDRGAN